MECHGLSGSNDYAGDIDDTVTSKTPQKKQEKKTLKKTTTPKSRCSPPSYEKESDSDQWVTDSASDEEEKSKQSEKKAYEKRMWESLRNLNIGTSDKPHCAVLTADKERKPGSFAANWKPQPKPKPESGHKKGAATTKKSSKPSRKSFDEDISEVCWGCGKKGPDNKRCSRCYSAMYCSQQCQRDDFQPHKAMCKRKGRFDAVVKKQNPGSPQPFYHRYYTSFPDYGDYEFFDEELTNGEPVLMPVIAEIVRGSFFHPWRHGANIMDVNGEELILVFYTDSQVFRRKQSGGGRGKKASRKMETIPLDKCLAPGNFVIIFQPERKCFLDGSTGFRIEDDAEVDFIFT